MYNLGEVKGFCLKSCYLTSLSNLFMNVMQLPSRFYFRADCRGPHAQMVSFFCFFTYEQCFAGRCCDNSQSTSGPAQCKSGPVNNMVIRRNNLLYRFSITIYLHLACFYATKCFEKKINKEKCSLNKILNMN